MYPAQELEQRAAQHEREVLAVAPGVAGLGRNRGHGAITRAVQSRSLDLPQWVSGAARGAGPLAFLTWRKAAHDDGAMLAARPAAGVRPARLPMENAMTTSRPTTARHGPKAARLLAAMIFASFAPVCSAGIGDGLMAWWKLDGNAQ